MIKERKKKNEQINDHDMPWIHTKKKNKQKTMYYKIGGEERILKKRKKKAVIFLQQNEKKKINKRNHVKKKKINKKKKKEGEIKIKFKEKPKMLHVIGRRKKKKRWINHNCKWKKSNQLMSNIFCS